MARLHCALGHVRTTLIRAGILPGSMSVFMRNGTAAIARSLSVRSFFWGSKSP